MQKKTEAAAAYGINHFIFDWYHYHGRPFLNGALDDGYLKIDGGPKVKFALMWANHDWLDIQPARFDGRNPCLLSGAVDKERFCAIADHVVERYFRSPHYWKIAGRCYFSIYDLPSLLRGLGGVEGAQTALAYLRTRALRAGLEGVHINLVHWQHTIVGSNEPVADPRIIIERLGFDSISSYAWIHHCDKFHFPATRYEDVMHANIDYWSATAESFDCPYFPNVTMGWDPSPRTAQDAPFEDIGYPYMATLSGNTPQNFRAALLASRDHVDRHTLPAKHISINAWNEWTEGSYLEPDVISGFAYLEAIRDVFSRTTASVRWH